MHSPTSIGTASPARIARVVGLLERFTRRAVPSLAEFGAWAGVMAASLGEATIRVRA